MNIPKEAYEYLDEYFPKGHKKRGDAMVLMAICLVYGREENKK